MKTMLLTIALTVAASITGPAQAAQQLLAPSARDQVPAALVAPNQVSTSTAARAHKARLERDTVQVSRALESSRELSVAPTPHVTHSRAFWSMVSAAQLRAGVTLITTAPGAVVRLSPTGSANAALDPASVRVRFKGRELSATEASTSAVSAEALRRAGMPVARGTLAFKLAQSVGSGEIEIAAPEARGRYLIHVLDTNSALTMNVSASRATVLVGTPIRFHVDISDADKSTRLAMVSGLVTAPDGYSARVDFARHPDGSYSARFTPDAAHSVGPALWEAHAFGATRSGKLMVLRDAKTAFAVSAPSAKLDGQVEIEQGQRGLRVSLGIETTRASRYQLSGVLHGTGRDGQLHPVALAQGAAWLSAGHGTVSLQFDAAALQASALHAPFELRDLRLVDQATMHLIERRSRALVIR